MSNPLMATWIEQRHPLSGSRINPHQVGLLVIVAVVTTQGEIERPCLPAVLSRRDVLDVQRHNRCGSLRQPAVLATVSRPPPPRLRSASFIATCDPWRGLAAPSIAGPI